MRNWVYSLVLTVGLCSTGCIPVPIHIATNPGASGVVIDSQTGQPLPGAKVVFSKNSLAWTGFPHGTYELATNDVSFYLTNTRRPMVLTGREGRFDLPSTGRWFIYWIPEVAETAMLLEGTLVVQHPGYQPALVPIVASSSNPKVKLEPVKLKPLPK